MKDKNKEQQYFDNTKTVYGPIPSWRFGLSLGIDPIFQESTCSFNCLYCQLGNIQNVTDKRLVYVKTQTVLDHYKEAYTKDDYSVITYSGSGEPTLAKNLGEIVSGIKQISSHIPQIILTNGTELRRDDVIEDLQDIDKVVVKVDAPSEEIFRRVNRPYPGITFQSVLAGIEKLKSSYSGTLEVQSMFMPINFKQVEKFAKILKKINPSLVQINTPKRAYPKEWHRENRGNHMEIFDYETHKLKVLSIDEIQELESSLQTLTGLKFLSQSS